MTSADTASSDKKALLRRLQSDMAIYQSDLTKHERAAQMLALEIRGLEKKYRELDILIKTKKQAAIKLNSDVFEANEQIRQIKKKINLTM